MSESETPIEEWLTSKPNAKGQTYEYVVLKGPGGGIIRRQGAESAQDARLRRAVQTEAKRAQQRGEASTPGPGPGRPKGKGREPDKPPRPEPPKPPDLKPTPTQAQLAAAAELPFAIAGAFIGRSMLGCEYCSQAMKANAGLAAADLAKSKNPYVRQLLVWWHGLMYMGAGREGLALFVGVPVIHHLAPQPMYEFVAPFMGMPPRAPSSGQSGHQHGPVSQGPGPAPGAQPPPPPPSPVGVGAPVTLTPQVAAYIATQPGLQAALARDDPQARAFVAELLRTEAQRQPTAEEVAATNLTGANGLTPEQTELAQLQAEKQRLTAINEMAARERARQAQMPTGNIPTYRAEDTLSPSQRRQMDEAELSRQMPGGLPNYNGGQTGAAGTPSAPSTDPAQSAGSPLPPEAEA